MSVHVRTLAIASKNIYMRPGDLLACRKQALKICRESNKIKKSLRPDLVGEKYVRTDSDFIAAFIIAFHAGPTYSAYGSEYSTYTDKEPMFYDAPAGKNRSVIDMYLLLKTNYNYDIDVFLDGLTKLAINMDERLYREPILNDFRGLKCSDVGRYVFSFSRHGSPFRIREFAGRVNGSWNNPHTDSGIGKFKMCDLLMNRDLFLTTVKMYREEAQLKEVKSIEKKLVKLQESY